MYRFNVSADCKINALMEMICGAVQVGEIELYLSPLSSQRGDNLAV